MLSIKLKNIDPEDITDLLKKVEQSFNIEFSKNELAKIKTFGQLCDHVTNKINLTHVNDSTSEQAYLKLRDAIGLTLRLEPSSIPTSATFDELFPRPTRRAKLDTVEQLLDLKLELLRPPHWLNNIALLLLVGSFIMLFFKWPLALVCFFLVTVLYTTIKKFGNETDVKTLKDIAEKMATEHYTKSRIDPKTFNKNEIEPLLTKWFIEYLDLDKNSFNRNTEFPY